MNTILFKNWLIKNNYSNKIASDTVSRLKKLNLALIDCKNSTSIDKEYENDNCNFLLSCFLNNGNNEFMESLAIKGLPIGKNSIHTYKLALTKYLKFMKDF